MHVDPSTVDAKPPPKAATVAVLRELEDEGRCPAPVVRGRGDGNRRKPVDDRDPGIRIHPCVRKGEWNRACTGCEQTAFGAGIARRLLEHRMVDALELRTDVI